MCGCGVLWPWALRVTVRCGRRCGGMQAMAREIDLRLQHWLVGLGLCHAYQRHARADVVR